MKFNIKKIVLACAIAASAAVAGVGATNVMAEGDTATSGQPDVIRGVALTSDEIHVDDGPNAGLKVSGIDHIVILPDNKPAGVDFSKAELSLKVEDYLANQSNHTIDVYISSYITAGDEAYSEAKYGGVFQIPSHQVTMNVSGMFQPGEQVIVTHNTNVGSETSTVTVAQDGTITFTNTLGYSKFSISPSPSPAPDSSSVSYDKRDKNQDGVVTCDEAYGEGWTWDENQKACVVSASASSASVPAANRNAVPKTGVKD